MSPLLWIRSPATRNTRHVTLLVWIHLVLLVFVPVLDAFDCFVVTIFNLLTADCNGKGFKFIPKGLEHGLQVMQFSDNQLTYVGEDEFKPYPSLQEIYLDRNKIDIVSPHAFRGLYNLQVVSLESNKLTEIPLESLKHLGSVRILNFRGNQISRIEADTLQSLTKIEDINFENNYIHYVDPNAFSGLNHLIEINLVNNELKTLSAEMQALLPQHLEVFRIYDNPWLCDCHLRWLREWLSTSRTSEINWDFTSNTPTCHGPELISNINWKHIDPPQFACAAMIVSNASTTQQVVLGSNASIECEVYGDPEPVIMWKKRGIVINKNVRIRKYTISEVGIKHIKSILTLQNIEPEDITDYKCIALNSAGVSEVTYKLWAEGVDPQVASTNYFLGFGKEVILGIAIGGALLTITLLCVVVVFLCRQQDRRKHAYKVREYRSASNGDQKSARPPAMEKHAPGAKQADVAAADSRQVASERKELLHTEVAIGDKSRASPAGEQLPVASAPQDPDNAFKMKVYATYDTIRDGVLLEGAACDDAHAQGPSSQLQSSPPPQRRADSRRDTPDLLKHPLPSSPGGAGAGACTPRAIPVPPPVVPCHLSSCHPRAEENPYVKPSELRAHTMMKRKTASADDLLDGVKDEPQSVATIRRGSRSRDDLDECSQSKQQKETPVYGTIGRYRTKDHSSTCKNPVCLKDPNLGLDHQDYTQRSRLKSPPKMAGTTREIDVDNLTSPESRGSGSAAACDRHNDRYKTLPGRLPTFEQRDQGQHSTPSTQSQYPAISSAETQYISSSTAQTHPVLRAPLASAQRPPSRNRPPQTKTVSFSEHGHPIIDLTQEMPEPIVISSHRKSPGRAGDYGTYSGSPLPRGRAAGGGGYTSPIPHVLRGPENISGVVPTTHKAAPMQGILYGSHKPPIPNGSPVRRLPAASVAAVAAAARQPQSTTLDDLLSPPFAHVTTAAQRGVQGNRTLPHKRSTPKPGEKDEFGTAV